MSASSSSIIKHLSRVDHERRLREQVPQLEAAVQSVKRYQQRRFMNTYADLLKSQRYGAAARFFLEELYGPTDFTRRDSQFRRVAPAIVHFFPAELVRAVEILAELHAISETLDSEMGRQLTESAVDATTYVSAWQATGHPDLRADQIALTLEIGATLDRYTRKPLLRQTLRIMRTPAHAAGLGELQRFLEAGYDAFKAMNGADEFLSTVKHREAELADALFMVPTGTRIFTAAGLTGETPSALRQLP